ncbi:sensor domain-containing diguanylate cyclase [Pseudomonas cichorii]|uniref:sensor domain-containing diguanylate cyclase n=1 Tax=Pseudomonas cichorii TaxID=36746 RepID=UPI001C8A7618|nr:sensor domain-containing diguanylate cyclase [Pseudomonas cichorii]MBX8496828.1 sensor domain-containing diguanylate cyclase [Pseudomonas cichorii]MBX8531035.1 sensor domain-containing diguanylate cyclase [Pseudomonas cichorii]MBX8573668.1 sensor domain-containing diguanylate cyclase [Pseudomonas cichorii]
MKSDLRLASLLIFVVCLCVVLLTAWQIVTVRQNTLVNIETNTVNLTSALSNYTEGMFRQSELMLVGLIERVEKEGVGEKQIDRLRSVVAQEMVTLKPLNSVVLYDAQGNGIFLSNRHIPRMGGEDREFFMYHKENRDRGVFIGPAFRSRVTNAWLVSISRRIDNPDSSFGGVMLITISIDHLLNFYSNIDVGHTGVISLSSSQGRLLVRYPFREADINRDLSSAPIFAMTRKNLSGTAEFISNVDGVDRLYAFKRSEHYPLVTTVAVGREEAMQIWWNQARQSIVVVLVLLGLLVALGVRLISHLHRRIRAENELLVSQAALIELNQSLELLASQDKLTGLANRRRFDQFLDIEFKRAKRDRRALSLILIDVDYFKLYNDHYGHLAGDECLKTISRIIEQCIRRPGDMAARYGGEEFAVVIPDTDEAGACAVAEAILEQIRTQCIEHISSPFNIVTISLGVATLAQRNEPVNQEGLIELADRALYSAKSQGKNQVSMASKFLLDASPAWSQITARNNP